MSEKNKLLSGVCAIKGKRDYMEDEYIIIENIDEYIQLHSLPKPPVEISPLFDENSVNSPMDLNEEISENEKKMEKIEEDNEKMVEDNNNNSVNNNQNSSFDPQEKKSIEVKYRGFVGVYDGHGGDKASKYCRDHLHKNLFFDTTFPNEISSSLVSSFESSNDIFLQSHHPRIIDDGTTAVVAVIEYFSQSSDDPSDDPSSPKGRVWVGNAGDSRCVIAKKREESVKIGNHMSEVIAIDLSNDHKPNDPLEKERVLQRGGIVAQSNFMGYNLGPMRIFDEKRRGGLAVARGIGDALLNHLVIATPDVTQTLFSPSHPFLLLATDGLWDVMSSQRAVDFAYHLFKEGKKPNEIAEEMTVEATRLGSLDNITVLLVFL